MKNRDFDLISSYVDTLSIPSELKKTIAFETFSKKILTITCATPDCFGTFLRSRMMSKLISFASPGFYTTGL